MLADLVNSNTSNRDGALAQEKGSGGGGLADVWKENKTPTGARVRQLILERLHMNVEADIVHQWPQVSTYSKYQEDTFATPRPHTYISTSINSPSGP